MKVIHVSPTYFSDESAIGGGERYVGELCRGMARYADVVHVSFGRERKSYWLGRVRMEIFPGMYFKHFTLLNPVSVSQFAEIPNGDVLHVHQMCTMVSDLSCLWARLWGIPSFVTDHGGGGAWVLNSRLPVYSYYRRAVAQSAVAEGMFPVRLRRKAVRIGGGIDLSKYKPDSLLQQERKVVFVGRLLPHKGIDVLIRGFLQLAAPGYRLVLIGRPTDPSYLEYLKELGKEAAVEFVFDASDERIVQEYQSAEAVALTSVMVDCHGKEVGVPELMGFTLLEAQACGTPVLCSDAGGMKEFVANGKTGYVSEAGNPKDVANSLRKLLGNKQKFTSNCIEWVQQFSWDSVVRKHLDLYAEYV